MSDHTKDRLARELRIAAEKASPDNAAKYEALAVRAEAGEFDDYGEVHDCGPTALFNELDAAGFTKFAGRVMHGEFDATLEESNEWAASPAGRAAFDGLSEELRREFGDPRLNN